MGCSEIVVVFKSNCGANASKDCSADLSCANFLVCVAEGADQKEVQAV